ncbi:hypothetical protein GRH90_15390 [Enterobacteriales bacterium SAP-6]|uniref:Lysylphosphatidylglycerol synthase-like protein n=1 Tax=Acerihabitans arboris TaxID=2691583 RepID=A0A845SMC7_9GAMM|nr:hypothetical protein [Acerihabitans arboris]
MSTTQLNLKRTLHWAGGGLAFIAIAFLAWRLHGYWDRLDVTQFTPSVWAAVMVLVLVCGGANLLLALSWWLLLTQSGVKATRWWAVSTYGISQLGKYLPGNIVHLAGRQVIGMAAGVPGITLAKSTLWELGLLAIAGSMYGLLAMSLLFNTLPIWISAGLFLSVVCGAGYFLQETTNARVAAAFFLHVVFLASSGAIFVALQGILISTSGLDMQVGLQLGAAYIIAWLAGLMTPGAPAGVGVREFVLMVLTKGILSEPDLLLIVLMARAVSVMGDFVFFLFSITMSTMSRR